MQEVQSQMIVLDREVIHGLRQIGDKFRFRVDERLLGGVRYKTMGNRMIGYTAGWRIDPDARPLGRVVDVIEKPYRKLEIIIDPAEDLVRFTRNA